MITNSGVPQPPSNVNNDSEGRDGGDGWMQRARDAYYSSTSYIDSNYRKQWEDSIRAFNNQHPNDSKYNSSAYSKRSNIFRPKTRSVIRKTEAAAAAAFFSNMDVVSIEATNQGDRAEVASAEVMKELLQYRLTKSIPWFQIVQGGIQDAQTTGVVCAYIYWDYVKDNEGDSGGDSQAQRGELGSIPTSSPKKPKVDKPCIDLVPIENLRIDMASNWTDPVGTSPFLIHLIPMYVGDIKEKMDSGEWNYHDDDVIKQAMQEKNDSTASARQGGDKQNPFNSETPVSDYQIVWVQRHIHRKAGQDWIFYTLSDLEMLTDPKPLEEEHFHGVRPFVIGKCILETHKVYSSSVPELTKSLQSETNEIANQRIDNVKFVLNKKWFVRQGRQVDVAALVRNVPGGAVMMTDPENDVREINFPDVTGSSFEEQNRLNADFDELAGNFSAGSVTTNRAATEAPMRTLSMLNQGANAIVEYTIRTYVETFILPVLTLLMKLEQHYESDVAIMAIAAEKAQLFQRFGMNEVTDELLKRDMTIKVNVGMGATDPQSRVQKFIAGVMAYAQIVKSAVPGLNTNEIGKEIFGHLGYQDGKRFLTNDNPRELQLQQGLQQALAMVQHVQKELQDKHTDQQLEAKKMQLDYDAKIKKIQEDYAKAQLQHTGKLVDMEGQKQTEIHKARQEQFKTANDARMKLFDMLQKEHDKMSSSNSNDKSSDDMKKLLKEIASVVTDIKKEMDKPKVIKRDKNGLAVAINDRRIDRDKEGNIVGLK